MNLRRRPILSAILFAIALCVAAASPVPAPAESVEASGLPIPRFVSLRAKTANLRIGPGVQYPVDWVYQRPGVPLEVVAEHKNWRKIRDWEGAQGWLHQSMLSGKRAMIVVGKSRSVRAEPNENAPAVAQVEPGVVGMVLQCRKDNPWCRIDVDGYVGWMHRFEMWGVYEDEVIE